jgi:hypothetical protein
LAVLRPSDVTVVTADGVALAVHVVDAYPSEPLPFDMPATVAGVR